MITETWQCWWLAAIAIPLWLMIAAAVWFVIALRKAVNEDDGG